MANTIKLKQGLSTALTGLTLAIGEPAFTTDTKKLYIGSSDGKTLINPDASNSVISVNGKTGAVTVSASDVGLGNVTNESKTTMFTNSSLTGIPTAPTAAIATNTTQIATTAYVKSQNYLDSSSTIDGGTF